VIASNVNIDLNGFTIARLGCEDESISCEPVFGSVFGEGIQDQGGWGVTVKNGSIAGMGRNAVRLDRGAEVSGLRLRSNWSGISVNRGSIVSRNTITRTRSVGIQLLGSMAYDNNIYNSEGPGILAIETSLISNNIVDTSSTSAALVCEPGAGGVPECSYGGNLIRNRSGDAVSGGVNAGGNVCNGLLTCP
jgi:hypothetical protein